MDLSDLRKENAVLKEEKNYYIPLVGSGTTIDLRREMSLKPSKTRQQEGMAPLSFYAWSLYA